MATPTSTIPSNLQPRDGEVFLINTPNYWGKGATLREARAALRSAGGQLKRSWRVYSAHPAARITDLGLLAYPRDAKPPIVLAESNP